MTGAPPCALSTRGKAGDGSGRLDLDLGADTRRMLGAAAWKVRLAAVIWYSFLVVVVGLRRLPLPELVERLARAGGSGGKAVLALPGEVRRPGRWALTRARVEQTGELRRHEPAWLGQVVWRVLHVGRWRPRCLHSSLVFLRLLRLHGHQAELVIGLPHSPTSEDAHAWVEMTGVDVGPPPGKAGHVELVRFG